MLSYIIISSLHYNSINNNNCFQIMCNQFLYIEDSFSFHFVSIAIFGPDCPARTSFVRILLLLIYFHNWKYAWWYIIQRNSENADTFTSLFFFFYFTSKSITFVLYFDLTAVLKFPRNDHLFNHGSKQIDYTF